jgi:hypothetical protein
MMEPLSTFHFAPEIEQSLVSLCFYAPERIAVLKRQLDLGLHFTRPELRFILQAIELAWGELGERDFVSVIQTLRELGHLEDCGGAPGVNQVFEEYRYGFSSEQALEQIFTHYIEMLKAYALGRQTAQPVFRFNRGDIILLPNKLKRSPASPDFVGEGKVAGRCYRAAEWINSAGHCVSLVPK